MNKEKQIVYVVAVHEYEARTKSNEYWRTSDFRSDFSRRDGNFALQEEMFDSLEDAEKLFAQTYCGVSRSKGQIGELIHYEVATLSKYTFSVEGGEKMSPQELCENYDFDTVDDLDLRFPDNEYIDPTDMDYETTDQGNGKSLIEFSYTYPDGETVELGAKIIDNDELPTDYDESGALYEKYLA